MPVKNRISRSFNPVSVSAKSPSEIASDAKLRLNKRETTRRAEQRAVVKHVCPVCAWESAASRVKKKGSRISERDH